MYTHTHTRSKVEDEGGGEGRRRRREEEEEEHSTTPAQLSSLPRTPGSTPPPPPSSFPPLFSSFPSPCDLHLNNLLFSFSLSLPLLPHVDGSFHLTKTDFFFASLFSMTHQLPYLPTYTTSSCSSSPPLHIDLLVVVVVSLQGERYQSHTTAKLKKRLSRISTSQKKRLGRRRRLR